MEDFKANRSRRDEIIRQLGFTAYHARAQNGDQEALINLLFQFKKSLEGPLRAEIVTAGTADPSLRSIIDYANTLREANVSQEVFKGLRKTITADGITEFNKIYEEVISICKIAGKFYKDQPALKEQFSFSKVSKALNLQIKAKTENK